MTARSAALLVVACGAVLAGCAKPIPPSVPDAEMVESVPGASQSVLRESWEGTLTYTGPVGLSSEPHTWAIADSATLMAVVEAGGGGGVTLRLWGDAGPILEATGPPPLHATGEAPPGNVSGHVTAGEGVGVVRPFSVMVQWTEES